MKTEQRIFKEAKDGYGFVETSQKPDGIYCTGCERTHKRPTKMYSNNRDTLCRYQMIRLYNPEQEN